MQIKWITYIIIQKAVNDANFFYPVTEILKFRNTILTYVS